MGIDDRSTNGQPYPHSVGLRRVESLENALEFFRINSRPRIAHGDEAIRLPLLGADQQLSWPIDQAHCFDRVQDQVQDDLLQLNTIRLNRKHPPRKPHLERDPMLGDCAPRQFNYLGDRPI
jgi:hypothetical protein